MKDISLTSDEKKELEKRGFLVKENFGMDDFFQGIVDILAYLGFYIWIFLLFLFIIFLLSFFIVGGLLGYTDVSKNISGILSLIVNMAIFAIPIFNFIYSYFITGKAFYTEYGMIQFGNIFKGEMRISKYLFFITEKFVGEIFSKYGRRGTIVYGLSILIGIVMCGGFILSSDFIYVDVYSQYSNLPKILILFLYGITFSILFSVFLISGRFLFQSFHPLYTFGNLGEKIQSLTPTISQKSQEIQKNFQSDMNFRVLSTGFDSLSTTFSEIITLVIRLEKVEMKANKGNLFDSEKYINSIKGDIIKPLKSLKTFLEQNRNELQLSQKELQKVRVGGSQDSGISPEGQAHAELSSKRSEPLLQELSENIEKLEGMIEKMG